MKKRVSLHKILFLSVIILSIWSTLIGGSAQALVPNKLSSQVQQAIESSQEGELQSVIVTLKAQANLANILDRNRRIRISRVIMALQNMADATQTRIRDLLETRQSEGKVAEVEYFWVFNGLAVTATADVIEELAALPEVRSITPNETILAPAGREALTSAEANLDIVNAPALWQLGYQGRGIVVANMDTGVYLNHPDLLYKWRGGTNSWFDPNGEHPSTPTDYNGHGTWTMGVMVGGDGGGTTVGVAPEAQWIAVKIFNDQGSATTAGIHAGFQWLLDPDGNPNTDDTPHVVNNSWTFQSPGCNLEFELDLLSLRAVGILPVFAAGNSGPNAGTSISPSNNPSAFAIGGIDNSGQIYTDSSRGPSSCGEPQTIFPEMVAPGVNIHTTDLYGFYTNASGTSLAAPHVAGGLALLLNAFPDLLAGDQEAALLNSSVDLGSAGPDNDFGYGRLDLSLAYQWLQSYEPTPTPTPAPNLALDQPVTVSSFQDNSHNGTKAVDGNTATYWQSKEVKGKYGPSSEWITVDLGVVASIDQVVLEWDSNYATSYTIQVSEDANTWSTVFSTSSANGGNDTITLSVGSARYVRMESTDWSDAKLRNWLSEFEIYGNSGGTTPTETPTPTVTPTPTSTPPPTATPSPGSGTLHIGDLDGFSSPGNRNRWDATVIVTVHDEGESLVSGATIDGSWSAGGGGSCVTDSLGQCSLTKNNLKGNLGSVTFTVDSISYSGYDYQPGDNHDPDGDSDGTLIIVSRP